MARHVAAILDRTVLTERLAAMYRKKRAERRRPDRSPPNIPGRGFPARARSRGGRIADEVAGRIRKYGTHFWGFENARRVPDVVVWASRLGMRSAAALSLRRKFAESFENGMEFFSTFGGNPVGAQRVRAVRDVFRGREFAANTPCASARIHRGLEVLQNRYALIGDVRGSGRSRNRFVLERETRAPDFPLASLDVVMSSRLRHSRGHRRTDHKRHQAAPRRWFSPRLERGSIRQGARMPF